MCIPVDNNLLGNRKTKFFHLRNKPYFAETLLRWNLMENEEQLTSYPIQCEVSYSLNFRLITVIAPSHFLLNRAFIFTKICSQHN